jgi:hypothetical protein
MGLGHGRAKLETSLAEKAGGAWPAFEGADAIGEKASGAMEVETCILASEATAVGDLGEVLRDAGEAPSKDFGHGTCRELAGGEADGRAKRGPALPGRDANRCGGKDISSVERTDNPLQADASLGPTEGEGGLDGRGSAESWQEGSVEIDEAEAGHDEGGLPQNLTVGHDEAEVGLERGKASVLSDVKALGSKER